MIRGISLYSMVNQPFSEKQMIRNVRMTGSPSQNDWITIPERMNPGISLPETAMHSLSWNQPFWFLESTFVVW